MTLAVQDGHGALRQRARQGAGDVTRPGRAQRAQEQHDRDRHDDGGGGTGLTYTQLQCIFILSSDDVTVEDCWFHDGFSSGIIAQASTNLLLSNNRLTGCGDNQIYVRAMHANPYTPCDYVTITGNIASGGAYSGIQVLGSSHIAITGNVCYSNGPSAGHGNGIGSEGASYVTITGNSCYANGVQGINIRFTSEVGANQRSSHVVVSSNVCYSHTSTDGDAGGINISDTDDGLITGNLVYGNYYGINVSNGGNGLSVLNLDIQGNIVRGSAAIGIRLAPGNASAYTISGNDVSGGSTVGIYANQQAWVKNNTVRGNTSFGIQFDSGAGSSIAEGNTVYDNGDNGIHVGGTGVANCVINDNYCTNVSGTQPRGIFEATGNGPTIALNNYITGQVTAPYAFNNSSSVYNTLENGSGQASFSGSATTGALVTLDATVRPNPGRSTSASIFLDNVNGQIYEFFCSNGGSFGVYDGTHSVQPFTINSNPSCTFSMTGNAVAIATGNLDVSSAGFGLKIAEGSNAKQGTATLNGTTAVVVGNTSVTANSRIFLTVNTPGGTVGSPYVSATSVGTSFSIKSTQIGDTSTVAWLITEPG